MAIGGWHSASGRSNVSHATLAIRVEFGTLELWGTRHCITSRYTVGMVNVHAVSWQQASAVFFAK